MNFRGTQAFNPQHLSYHRASVLWGEDSWGAKQLSAPGVDLPPYQLGPGRGRILPASWWHRQEFGLCNSESRRTRNAGGLASCTPSLKLRQEETHLHTHLEWSLPYTKPRVGWEWLVFVETVLQAGFARIQLIFSNISSFFACSQDSFQTLNGCFLKNNFHPCGRLAGSVSQRADEGNQLVHNGVIGKI